MIYAARSHQLPPGMVRGIYFRHLQLIYAHWTQFYLPFSALHMVVATTRDWYPAFWNRSISPRTYNTSLATLSS